MRDRWSPRSRHDDGRATAVEATATDGGASPRYPCDHVISSMPISAAARGHGPAGARRGACRRPTTSRYRDFLSVALVVPEADVPSTDNWIYIHDPEVEVGRIQNFGSWSPYMVKDGRNVPRPRVLRVRGRPRCGTRPTRSSSSWASGSSRRSASSTPTQVEAGYVVRHAEGVSDLRRALPATTSTCSAGWLGRTRPNVHPVGRNGMHRYNNQDHSMYTAHAHRREHRHRHPPRHLGGQRRGGVPRGRPRASVPRTPASTTAGRARGHRARRADHPARRVRSRPGPAGVSAPTERRPRLVPPRPRRDHRGRVRSGGSSTRSSPGGTTRDLFDEGDAFFYSARRRQPGQRQLVHRCPFNGQPAADHPPLTVLVLGPTARLFPDSVLAQRLTMTVIGTVAIVAIGLLARAAAGSGGRPGRRRRSPR